MRVAAGCGKPSVEASCETRYRLRPSICAISRAARSAGTLGIVEEREPASPRLALHHLLGRALVINLLCGLSAVATFAAVAHVLPSDVAYLDITKERTSMEDTGTERAARLLAKHADSCWKAGEPPKAPLPDAAIVESMDHRTGEVEVTYTDRHALVDDAFSEALGESHRPGLTTIALCTGERS